MLHFNSLFYKSFENFHFITIFRRHYNQIKDNFPRQWLRTLKNEDPYDGEIDTIFLLQNDNTFVDVQNATTKDLYTAILTKTNTEVLCKAKWENVFGDKIIWEYIWKTIHSGLIDNWDLNIIYKLIHQVIAVRKKPISLEDCAHAWMSCMFGRGLSLACLFLLREN